MPSPLEALPLSAAVFEGTVLRRTPVLLRFRDFLVVVEEYEFVVEEAWHGSNAERLVLLQGLDNCSSHFQVGSRYLVFATLNRDVRGRLTSSICLPTQPFETAKPALTELGPAFRFANPPPAFSETPVRRLLRHLRASLLCGMALTVSIFTFPRWVFEDHRAVFLFGPTVVLCAFVTLLYCAVRRRYRLLVAVTLPVLVVAALLLAVQGYLFLRSMPLWWHLIDYLPPGV